MLLQWRNLLCDIHRNVLIRDNNLSTAKILSGNFINTLTWGEVDRENSKPKPSRIFLRHPVVEKKIKVDIQLSLQSC